MADTAFLTYVHARPNTKDASDIFYVGKGSVRRSKDVAKGRNLYHARVVAKHGAENILVGMIPCSSEAIAFDLERGLIKCLRRMGVKLTNMTDGGEGTSGHIRPQEQRKRITERQLQELAEGRHHTQRQEVVENIRRGHRRAMEAGTHSSIANNPMKNPESAKKSLQTRIEKYGASHFSPSEKTKEKIVASTLRLIADGSHHFLTNHPMKNPEVAARQGAKVRGRKKMISASGVVKMVPQESITVFVANGWVLARPCKGE